MSTFESGSRDKGFPAQRFESYDEQRNRLSEEKAQELVDLYRQNAKEPSKADGEVHDRLLKMRVEAQHGAYNMKLVESTLKDGVSKMHDPGIIIKDDGFGKLSRDYKLPILGIEMSAATLYDPIEASKAIAEDDKRRQELEAAKRGDGIPKIDLFDGTMGVKSAFEKLLNPEKK